MADLQMDSMPASSDAPHPSHTKQHRLSKQTPTVHQDEGAPGEQLISQSSGEGLSSCCPFNSSGFISRMLPSTGYSAGYNGRRATCRLHLFAILYCTALAALAIGPFAWGKWSKSPTMLEDDGLLSTSDFSAPLPTESTILTLLAHGSCAHQNKAQPFWNTMRRLKPQLFIFNGDIMYGDCKSSECPELDRAWQDLFSHSSFASARREIAITGVLDDHDYGENDCHAANPHKALAKDLFLSRFGVPAADERRRHGGLYTASAHGPPGKRVQLILLDTRWFRSPFLRTDCWGCPGRERYVPYNQTSAPPPTPPTPVPWPPSPARPPPPMAPAPSKQPSSHPASHPAGAAPHPVWRCAALGCSNNAAAYADASCSCDARCRPRGDCCEDYAEACERPEGPPTGSDLHAGELPTMLGEEQWRWLGDRLREPADLRFIVSTIQVLADNHGWEKWRNMPDEVRRLQRLISETGASGVVLLSGDRHVGAVYRLAKQAADGGPYDLFEVTASSLTHSIRPRKSGPDESDENRLFPLVHENNFGTVGIDWTSRQVTLSLVSADDCGVAESRGAWPGECAAHNDTAGRVIQSVTLPIDQLRAE